jgi:hypothetical protein
MAERDFRKTTPDVPVLADSSVGQALVIALDMVMGHEVVNGCPQRPLSDNKYRAMPKPCA